MILRYVICRKAVSMTNIMVISEIYWNNTQKHLVMTPSAARVHIEVPLTLLRIAVSVVMNILYKACYTHMHIRSHIYKLKYCTTQYCDIYLTERTNTFVCTPTSTIVASLATLYQTAPD